MQRQIELDSNVPQLDSDQYIFIEFTDQGQFSMHVSQKAMEQPQLLVNLLTQVLLNHVFHSGMAAGAQQVQQLQQQEQAKPRLVLPR